MSSPWCPGDCDRLRTTPVAARMLHLECGADGAPCGSRSSVRTQPVSRYQRPGLSCSSWPKAVSDGSSRPPLGATAGPHENCVSKTTVGCGAIHVQRPGFMRRRRFEIRRWSVVGEWGSLSDGEQCGKCGGGQREPSVIDVVVEVRCREESDRPCEDLRRSVSPHWWTACPGPAPNLLQPFVLSSEGPM